MRVFCLQILIVLSSSSIAFTALAGCQSAIRYPVGNGTVYEYSGKNSSPNTQVVVLPPTGGINSADRSLARQLCNKGNTVRIFDYQQFKAEFDLSVHDRAVLTTLKDLDLLFDIFPYPTVLIGASLGGIYTSLAYGASTQNGIFRDLHRIQGMVTVVAGGPLGDVLANSKQEIAREQRDQRMKAYNLKSTAEYAEFLNSIITYDPLKWAQPNRAGSVLMLTSSDDDFVSPEAQEALWKAWGQPQRRVFNVGHKLTIAQAYFLYADYISNHVSKILNQNLASR
jgi:pimeloyl-ACP methyl ester carboxylesterase